MRECTYGGFRPLYCTTLRAYLQPKAYWLRMIHPNVRIDCKISIKPPETSNNSSQVVLVNLSSGFPFQVRKQKPQMFPYSRDPLVDTLLSFRPYQYVSIQIQGEVGQNQTIFTSTDPQFFIHRQYWVTVIDKNAVVIFRNQEQTDHSVFILP